MHRNRSLSAKPGCPFTLLSFEYIRNLSRDKPVRLFRWMQLIEPKRTRKWLSDLSIENVASSLPNITIARSALYDGAVGGSSTERFNTRGHGASGVERYCAVQILSGIIENIGK